jgi:hypothetical protein
VKPLVVIVNGYGTILDSPLGHVYLPRVLKVIMDNRPEMVIFCGGRTFLKTMPSLSEASVMENWIRKHLDPTLEPRLGYRTNDDSYTTLENARGAAYYLREQAWRFWPPGQRGFFKVIHCCEATRAANVVMLDRHFLVDEDQLVESIDDITVETASWERADPFKQAGNLIYNRLAIKIPWLGLAERERRRRVAASERR